MKSMNMDTESDGSELRPEAGQHPQVKAFSDAAGIMRGERYWQPSHVLEDQIDFLQVLEAVATELVFQLSRYGVMDQETGRVSIVHPLEQQIGTLHMLRDL